MLIPSEVLIFVYIKFQFIFLFLLIVNFIFVIVIELCGMQFSLKSYMWFQNRTWVLSTSSIWSHKYQFKTKIAQQQSSIAI